MFYDECNPSWFKIAEDFVFNMSKKKQHQHFINMMNQAKIQTERQMRLNLDKKLLFMKEERLAQALDIMLADKIRHYIKMYYTHKDKLGKDDSEHTDCLKDDTDDLEDDSITIALQLDNK